MKYDIIGDIHGCAKTLILLLEKLGYQPVNGIYQQAGHQVIFLGDFIDRGPYQRDVINIIRPMIENGYALSVMGNHEYNAIAYATRDENNADYLRKHNEKNARQHQKFLEAYPFGSAEYHQVIEWFKTLPLWLELENLRVVHACWDFDLIARLDKHCENQLITEQLLRQSSRVGSWQFNAIETILKGKEIPLPDGYEFKDKDGNSRHHIRIRWWDKSATTFNNAYMGPESARTHIPNDEIDADHLIEYRHEEKPVFIGHFWLDGEIDTLAPNITCLDYSVAKPATYARLAAYRFNGEKKLDKSHFVSVVRQES